MTVGDRVRVMSGTLAYEGMTGVIIEDDGEYNMNLWVLLDQIPEDEEGTPFSEHELRVIET